MADFLLVLGHRSKRLFCASGQDTRTTGRALALISLRLLFSPLASGLSVTRYKCQFSSRAPLTGAHHVVGDFSSALRLVDSELAGQADQVWVIGGSSLYKELMESSGTKRLYVTRILKQFECDTFLPEISPDKYRLLPESPGVLQELQEDNGIQYRFEVYESIDQ
ncbi:dihydrofolate reductase-like [Micropterus dolomieu]|uniref:dihydrofolate reductase-like n=1 Tax=Micropterus dolomieu TaxID=147949 RepID=UPI001E8D1E36|nr:dihydrofolate reductase-like [Micropterus dolomieu]